MICGSFTVPDSALATPTPSACLQHVWETNVCGIISEAIHLGTYPYLERTCWSPLGPVEGAALRPWDLPGNLFQYLSLPWGAEPPETHPPVFLQHL